MYEARSFTNNLEDEHRLNLKENPIQMMFNLNEYGTISNKDNRLVEFKLHRYT